VSEISQYLPFSQRPRRDESAVTNNWARHTGTVLLELADALSLVPATGWDAASLRPTVTVRQAVAELGWLLGSTRRERAASTVRGVFRTGQLPNKTTAARISQAAEAHPAELVARIREIATGCLTASATRSVGELAVAVVAAFELAAATGQPLTVDPVASGAVALARSLTAPLPIRAVIRERTLVATDADWMIGSGQKIEATAAVLILFLYERHGFPARGG
jgi:hypothetical protein